MKNSNLFVMVALLTLSLPALAVREVGNGGDAVVCRDQSGAITRAELLDTYEARVERGIQLPEIKGDEPVAIAKQEVIAMTTLSGKTMNPDDEFKAPAFRLYYLVDHFLSQTQFVESGLIDLDDSRHILVPHGCVVEQVAINRTPKHDLDKTYLVDRDIWIHLNVIDQAALIFHEALWRIADNAQTIDEKTSENIRYFVSTLFAEKLSFKEYIEFASTLARNGRESYDNSVEGTQYDLGRFVANMWVSTYMQKECIGSICLSTLPMFKINQENQLAIAPQPYTRGKNTFYLKVGSAMNSDALGVFGYVTVDHTCQSLVIADGSTQNIQGMPNINNGSITYFHINNEGLVTAGIFCEPTEITMGTINKITVDNEFILFDSNVPVERLHLSNKKVGQTLIAGRNKIEPYSDSYVFFYPNGIPKKLLIYGKQCLFAQGHDKCGTVGERANLTVVMFDEKGDVSGYRSSPPNDNYFDSGN